jgi:hypothetical protein
MALGDNYATLAEMKAYLSLTDTVAADSQITDALNSASREIERHCERQFNSAGSVSARVFNPNTVGTVWVDDFSTVTGLIVETDADADGTFETIWTSADYELNPLNGIVDGQTGWPYYKIRAVGNSLRFPVWCGPRKATVRVTANWGWATVPAPVKQSCMILAAMSFQLKDAPLGVAGMGEFGVIRVRNSRMAEDKLNDYCRNRVKVG